MNRLVGVSHQRSWEESSGVTLRSFDGGSVMGSKRVRYQDWREHIFSLACRIVELVEAIRPNAEQNVL